MAVNPNSMILLQGKTHLDADDGVLKLKRWFFNFYGKHPEMSVLC